MIHIPGAHNTAICYTDALEPTAETQIKTVCDRPEFADSQICVMPDVHAGMGCTIGTTMTISDKIVPGMVGVDIGCGMETVQLAERNINYAALDNLIRKQIPSGRDIRKTHHPYNEQIDLEALRCVRDVDLARARRSIGTLGGGNHFIEVAKSEKGALYLVVHSGSRHIGTEVAEYYQEAACKSLFGMSQKQRRAVEKGDKNDLPSDLTYVSGALFDNYIHDMKLIQQFATLNRKAMTEVILTGVGLTETDRFTTIHNYIDTDSMILRKGAVSAKAGERLLIPINMRDGSLICIGKGNPDWNYSAPHGAGRLYSRSKAKNILSLDDYKETMKGIFSTCINHDTLDEAPFAYKDYKEIMELIEPTVEIKQRLIPIYNFKASE